MQYGGLLSLVENDRLYVEAFSSIGLVSHLPREKRANLYLLITRFLPKLAHRNIVEFGSFEGGTALFKRLFFGMWPQRQRSTRSTPSMACPRPTNRSMLTGEAISPRLRWKPYKKELSNFG